VHFEGEDAEKRNDEGEIGGTNMNEEMR